MRFFLDNLAVIASIFSSIEYCMILHLSLELRNRLKFTRSGAI